MEIYSNNKPTSGYKIGEDGIDSYGVDHNKLTNREEIAYQMARVQREQEQQKQFGEQRQNLINILDYIYKQVQNRTPMPWNNTVPYRQTTPTPWRSNQTLAPWAGGYNLNIRPSYQNTISDEDLHAKMWENIKQFERVVAHPYLDTKGNITIGGGANVHDWNVFKNLNVTVDGIPATEAQKWEAYNRMRQLSEEKDTDGNYVNRNLKAKTFENKTNIRISDSEARNLAQNHMNNDLAHLRREFSDFDSFPLPLKEVLLDIQYNTGNLTQPNWPNLYRAIRSRDVDGIASNVHRRDVQQERNDWARDTALSIRF